MRPLRSQLLFLCLALGLAGCVGLSPSGPPLSREWPHAQSDLRPDAAVTWGRLENGLRYAILPHASPRHRATVILLVQAGSFHERNGELGYAHLVEHMAFRELRDFPHDSASARLMELGVGPHANAFTTPFDTRYFFPDLPTDDPAALASGFKILRAMADGISFVPQSVQRERGVVLGEQRSHEGVIAHVRSDLLEFLPPRETELRWPEVSSLFHRTRLAERHPLGTDRSVERATPAALRRFYDRWYRPDRMILAVVGDVSPADVEARVREAFGSMAARTSAPNEPFLPPPANPGHLAIFGRDAEPTTQVSLGVVRNPVGRDSVRSRREALVRKLALAMLARRLDQASNAADAPLVASDAFASHLVPNRELVILRATARRADWRRAMLALDYEVRRINEQGFHPVELALAAKVERSRADAAARQAAFEHSTPLANLLAYSVARGVVFTSAADERALALQQLEEIEVKECHEAFRTLLLTGEWGMALTGSFGPDNPGPTSFNFKESRTRPLQPYEPPALPAPFPFVDFGPPGEIASQGRLESVEVDTYLFANGVRLNLKRTPFEPGRARVEFRFAGGRMACPPDQPGLDWRSFGWLYGGIEGITPDDLSNMMAGALEGFQYTVGPTSVALQARVDADRLPLLFQAGAAFVERPAFREDAFVRSLEIARQVTASYVSTAPGVALLATWERMSGRHPSFRGTRPEELGDRTVHQLKAWFGPLLKSAPLEISVIGDVDPAVVLDACARTLGALPGRTTVDPFAAQRSRTAAPAAYRDAVTFAGPKALAVVSLAWPAPEAAGFPGRFRAHLLSAILTNRLSQKLRVEMAETYSARASFEIEDGFDPPVAFVQCQIEAAPGRAEQVAAAAREVVASLHAEGATAGELELVRAPLVRATETGLRDNDWWLDVVSAAQSNPSYGDGWARALGEYRSATLTDINALIRAILDPSRRGELIARPEETAR